MSICSAVCSALFLVLLVFSTHDVLCDELPDIQSDSTEALLSILKNFNGKRNHITGADGKKDARNYITKSFKEYGLQVWSEREMIGGSLLNENIIGMIRSTRTGTADDKIVVVGAHYDTAKNTNGVDDNGSGVTALLEVAKIIGKARCQVKNTIFFVAFDFEERTKECNITDWTFGFDCGSISFVRNMTSYLKKTGGTMAGAIVLETMLNHNSSAGSQSLPFGFEYLLPKAYNEVKNDEFRGNFLVVIGRRESDKKLLSLIPKYFSNDSDYRVQPVICPINGRPSLTLNYRHYSDLYRSDHFAFWESKASYSALMLGDTANFRGYMQYCYHRECDDLSHVKEDDLQFLQRSINAVIKTVLDLSEVVSCNDQNHGMEISFNLLLMLVSLCGMFAM
ncbi:uncharacterized protein LOC114520917 [Dendronephthya gigantea]|uniref:uncharacterized protein LOC114520917 n=1 Tax=Dendronephthya gigantea TaxID=151771 RepID=UPI001069D7BE|nr:uncharacterized protein LOC114520917 [Dendronephthya gigantea]